MSQPESYSCKDDVCMAAPFQSNDPSSEEEDSTHIVLLSMPCLHAESGEEKCFELVIKFRDEQQEDILSDCSYDMILEMFNDALKKKYGDGWFIDDTPEPTRDVLASENLPVDLDLTNYDEMS